MWYLDFITKTRRVGLTEGPPDDPVLARVLSGHWVHLACGCRYIHATGLPDDGYRGATMPLHAWHWVKNHTGRVQSCYYTHFAPWLHLGGKP